MFVSRVRQMVLLVKRIVIPIKRLDVTMFVNTYIDFTRKTVGFALPFPRKTIVLRVKPFVLRLN